MRAQGGIVAIPRILTTKSKSPKAPAFHRYDDEIVPTTARAQLYTLLSVVLFWAQQCLAE